MEALKTTVVVGGGIAGGSGVIGAGGYAVHKFTEESIEERLKEEGLTMVNLEDSDWLKLEKKLKTSIDGNKVDDEELKGLGVNGTAKTGKLETWCNNSKPKIHSSKVLPAAETLLNNVRAYCFITIKEKLDDKALDTSNGSSSSFNTPFNTLKAHEAEPSLDKESRSRKDSKKLSVIKSNASASSGATTAEDLKNWCKETYTFLYQGNNDSEFKLAEKFCVSS